MTRLCVDFHKRAQFVIIAGPLFHVQHHIQNEELLLRCSVHDAEDLNDMQSFNLSSG